MGKKDVNIIVEAGKATPGPPLGPSLAPLGINVAQVVAKINEETHAFAGLKVPVKVSVDTISKGFTIEVGAPATAELVKKTIGLQKGAGTKDKVGNIAFSALKDIAKGIKSKSQGKTLKEIVKEIVGTCVSMGITIDNKEGKQVEKEIKEGAYNSMLAG